MKRFLKSRCKIIINIILKIIPNSLKDYILQYLNSIYLEQKYLQPGHYYSPIPNLKEIKERGSSIYLRDLPEITGIDLNIEEQMILVKQIALYLDKNAFPVEKQEGMRFYHKNPSINYSDSLSLHAMIRKYRPKRIIEVGSGYSSAMILDTNEKYLHNSIKCTFIEPYPETFYSILKTDDKEQITVIKSKLQDVELSVFMQLESGDILFVDSTHVSKIGSDVNFMFFQVLPILKSGVLIHFHDILYPFEYPQVWTFETLYHWNEAYLLRAFLQYNLSFRIKLWSPCLAVKTPEIIETYFNLPDVANAGSIWIEKN